MGQLRRCVRAVAGVDRRVRPRLHDEEGEGRRSGRTDAARRCRRLIVSATSPHEFPRFPAGELDAPGLRRVRSQMAWKGPKVLRCSSPPALVDRGVSPHHHDMTASPLTLCNTVAEAREHLREADADAVVVFEGTRPAGVVTSGVLATSAPAISPGRRHGLRGRRAVTRGRRAADAVGVHGGGVALAHAPTSARTGDAATPPRCLRCKITRGGMTWTASS